MNSTWQTVLALFLALSVQVLQAQEGFDRQSEGELRKAEQEIKRIFIDAVFPESLSRAQKAEALGKYAHLDPNKLVPEDLLEQALLFFDANREKFPNQNFLTVVDFSPRSDRQRLYLVDLKTGLVERYFTTHGVGSDRDEDGYAERFGNVVNSGMSSLGYVRVSEVYWGKYNRSIRLDGLSSTNSNIRRRAVVLHGWDDVKEEPLIQGLSWGCITLDWSIKDNVVDKVRDGSLMFVGVSQEDPPSRFFPELF